jgi:hypothetical protein
MWVIVFWVVIVGVVLAVPELIIRAVERRQERKSLRRRFEIWADELVEEQQELKQATDDFLWEQLKNKTPAKWLNELDQQQCTQAADDGLSGLKARLDKVQPEQYQQIIDAYLRGQLNAHLDQAFAALETGHTERETR